jgi:hypothetical protein
MGGQPEKRDWVVAERKELNEINHAVNRQDKPGINHAVNGQFGDW